MTGTYLPFFQLLTQQPTWVLHRHGKLDSSQPEQEKSASILIVKSVLYTSSII